MAHLYVTIDSTVSPPQAHFYIRSESSTTATEVPAPAELGPVPSARKPVLLRYRKRTYVVGIFRRPFLVDEFGTGRAAGVRPPKIAPVLANGSFTGGSTGNMVGYQTFAVKSGDRLIAESNPGPASNMLAATGTGRTWTNLDWSPDDSFVTHSRGYVSAEGEAPAMAWERPLGVDQSVTENVLTAALSIPLPVRIAPDGTITLDAYARGVPPYTYYVEKYHDAFFYAGDPQHPERIYPSRLYEPEAVNTTPITVYGRTENPWLSTTDGMPVTGIKRQGEDLVVGTLKGIDVIQGYTHGDYTIRRISDYWGVLSHFSMARCGPLSSLFFAAPQGPTIYNAGAFKFIGGPIETWWRDNYKLYPAVFADSFGVEDRYWRSYKLLLPWFASSHSLYLVCDYETAEMGDPIWVMDRRNRRDECMGELLSSAEGNYYEMLTGSCDGMVRRENVADDPDDDGDTYQKKLTIRTPHRFPLGQEGDSEHGRTYVDLDVHLKHTNQDATFSCYGGDDDASSAVAPQWSVLSPATGAPTGSRPLVDQSSEHHAPSDLSGKGVTLKVEVTAPVDVEFRGWAFEHVPGPQARPFKT